METTHRYCTESKTDTTMLDLRRTSCILHLRMRPELWLVMRVHIRTYEGYPIAINDSLITLTLAWYAMQLIRQEYTFQKRYSDPDKRRRLYEVKMPANVLQALRLDIMHQKELNPLQMELLGILDCEYVRYVRYSN